MHSLTKLLALEERLTFTCVAPAELQLPESLVRHLRARGHEVMLTEDLAEGIRDVDVFYATRVQEERFPEGIDVSARKEQFRIDAALYDKACRPGTVLMHPLPRDSRGGTSELADSLNTRGELAIFRQTDNGIPVRMALFALVLDVADQVTATDREATWFTPRRFGVLDTRDILS